ncbi:MAG: DUF3887 domain-containing protein [Vagococcus sp.]|uniref:DUF3887 domain-containing protein n=1 Tax=Vagococcus sp. TaxID=1933889 RepID=UPI002FCBFF73
MKKIVKICLFLCVGLFIFTGCKSKVDSETSDKYTKKAESIIQLINEGDNEKLNDSFDSTMKEGMTPDKYNQIADIIVNAGEFRSFTKSTVSEKDDKVSVITMTKYDKATITFTISFNKEDKVAGLWLK